MRCQGGGRFDGLSAVITIAAAVALFAALSILVNIGTQMAAMALYAGPGAVFLSIGLGTLTIALGLITPGAL